MTRRLYRFLLAVPALMLVVGTGACIQDIDDLPEGAEEELLDGPDAEPLANASCTSQCNSEYLECFNDCKGLPFPDRADCFDWCGVQQSICLQGSYTLSQNGSSICHLDIDQHLFNTVIEFYTADTYSDNVCGNPDKYKKRLVGTVSCSTWTGLTNPSVCTSRVENKLAQLAAQGYIPTFTQPDTDQCPTPRL